MNPDRWQQIELLFNQAIEKEPGQRSAFLMEACRGDEDLRATLESLLGQEGSFLDRAASAGYTGLFGDVPRTVLTPSTAIGPYRIEGLLGSGGMGEVWKARDTRLNRPVAIKLLSASSADA